jgi:hypothetical protein
MSCINARADIYQMIGYELVDRNSIPTSCRIFLVTTRFRPDIRLSSLPLRVGAKWPEGGDGHASSFGVKHGALPPLP